MEWHIKVPSLGDAFLDYEVHRLRLNERGIRVDLQSDLRNRPILLVNATKNNGILIQCRDTAGLCFNESNTAVLRVFGKWTILNLYLLLYMYTEIGTCVQDLNAIIYTTVYTILLYRRG